jgi:hypothetical protein
MKYNRFMRSDSFFIDEDWSYLRDVLLPNTNILDGIPSANIFDPLVSARYERWMDALEKIEKTGDKSSFMRLLNLMGVGVVEYLNQDQPSGVGFEQIENSQRIRWVPCARIVPHGEEAWDVLISENLDFRREVIIEEEAGSPGLPCKTENYYAQLTRIDEKPNLIKMNTSSPDEGWLVLSDVWYPGWKAEVDGQRTIIYRANYLFRAVSVPAGEHTVVWKYQPGSFMVGLLITLAAWILVGIFWIIFLTRLWRNR